MKKTHSMAKSQQIVNHLPKTAAKCLVIAVASLMSISASQADTANKQIGDLEIYQSATPGKTTLMLMIDKSGSMDRDAGGGGAYACEMGGYSNFTGFDQNSGTTPAYTRKGCRANKPVYYYLKVSGSRKDTWYGCGSGNKSECTTNDSNQISQPNPLPSSSNGFEADSARSYTYYYKNTPIQNVDRLTRVKDGLFDLLQGNAAKNITKLSDDIVVGLSFFSATGKEGYISVPARALNQSVTNGGVTKTQREWLLQSIADIKGGGLTPTAHAYAEVGAYMMGTNTTNTVQASASGMGYSSTDSKSGANYLKPASLLENNAQCSGQGIYFLTDGNPNSTGYYSSTAVMKASLGSTSSSFSCDGSLLSNINSSQDDSWDCIYKYSQALLDPSKNPAGRMFKTAVVGFGSDFSAIPSYDKTKTEAENISSIDGATAQGFVQNAAKWGVYGKGGWYRGSSSEDVVNSVTEFLGTIGSTYIAPSPSGTIVVPEDPYNAASQLPVAYYPSLQSNVAGNSAIWQGNMKKYSLFNGSLFGLNDTNASTKLFLNDLGTTGVSTTNGTGSSGKTDPTVRDLWASADVPAKNDLVDSGGSLEHVKVPTTAKIDNVRTVYVEDGTVLKKFGVDLTGKVTLVDLTGKVTLGGAVYSDTNTFVDTIYTKEKIQALIQFLGFTLSDADKALAIKDLTLTTPSNAKPYGATIHSVPAAVSYSAKLDPTTGRVTNERDDYVLFGSMDGALHMVNADSYLQTATALDNAKNISQNGGSEVFAFIPKTIIANQSNALIKGATGNGIGQPYFGMDAPWLVTTNYRYDLANNQVNVDTSNSHGVFAYGGLRMGGAAMYGINLTDKVNPSLMFAITPATTGFGRMGQIWAKPTKAKIKTSTTDTGTDVLIFGGGYDTCYENPYFQVGVTADTTNKISTECAAKTQAQGNAVYMVNARTGTLIWSASNTTNGNGSSINTNMKNSIVGGINALDRNSDGFMDHLYFADLGGQVFRADFTNAGSTRYTTTTTATGTTQTATAQTAFANQRVTRILSDTPNTTLTGSMKLRFYERPVVSFYRNPTTQRLFTLINVISGDRSSPLTKIRAAGTEDRVYGIIDTDVNKAVTQLFDDGFNSTSTTNTQNIINLTDSNLTALPLDLATNRTTTINTAKAAMNNGTSRGWYYPLNRFEGFLNVYNGKGVGKSEVIGNYLYTTVYSPDMNYDTSASCSAKIIGGSERQLYCLPYGICSNATSLSGTGGFVRAGKGIQELTLGPRSDSLANQKVLVGTETLDQRASPRVGYGNDDGKVLASNGGVGLTSSTAVKTSGNYKGDGSAAEFIFNERYVLTPSTWYEVAK